jgi:hypothetical protein
MTNKRSFILFLKLFLTKFIVENILSTLVIVIDRISTNLRKLHRAYSSTLPKK